MKITASKNSTEGTRAFLDGDLIVAYHTEDVGRVLRANYERQKDPSNGWSKDKHFRHFATVTELALKVIEKHHPEVKSPVPQDQIKAWHKVYYCESCNPQGAHQWFTVPGGV